MDRKLLVTKSGAETGNSRDHLKASHTALSDVDEILLRSDIILQRSQQDDKKDRPESRLTQNPS